MAKSAAPSVLGRGSVTAVGSVGHIFPFSVAEFLVRRAEAPLLPHGEYCGQRVGNETSIAVEERLPRGVLSYCVALKENDRAVWKIEHLSRSDRGSDRVAIYRSDLPVLVVIKRV